VVLDADEVLVVSKQTPEPAKTVTLSDQFIPDATLTVDEPLQFCAPTSKDGAEILEPEEHVAMYAANQELTPHLTVFTEDQFGARTLEVVGARVLLVPTQKLVGDRERLGIQVAGRHGRGLDRPRFARHSAQPPW
jgi:hypothetical protein